MSRTLLTRLDSCNHIDAAYLCNLPQLHCLGTSLTTHLSPGKISDKIRDGSLSIPNVSSSHFLEKESECLTFWSEAVGFGPCVPRAWPPAVWPRQVTAAEEGLPHVRVSCHQVTVAQRVAQCRSQQEDVQLKGQNTPRKSTQDLLISDP